MIKPEWTKTTRSEYRWWLIEMGLMYHIEGPSRTSGTQSGMFTATRHVVGQPTKMIAYNSILKEVKMKVLQDYEEWLS